ncbi:MAG: CHASE sensor domain-containing protein [Pseudomonadales bacterium]
MNMFKSLKVRLLLSMVFLVVLVIVVILWAVISSQTRAAKEQAESELASISEMVAGNTVAALLFLDPVAAKNTLDSLKAKPDIYKAIIYDADGKVFSEYGFSENPLESMKHEVMDIIKDAKSEVHNNEN